jgi:hypothetical protein
VVPPTAMARRAPTTSERRSDHQSCETGPDVAGLKRSLPRHNTGRRSAELRRRYLTIIREGVRSAQPDPLPGHPAHLAGADRQPV